MQSALHTSRLLETGWTRFDFDQELAEWTNVALPLARTAVQSPEHEQWLRCGGTWFVGVNSLPNNPRGGIGDWPEIPGTAARFVETLGLGDFDWDQGQISVMYPGYPKQGDDEPDSVHRFRLRRDAAHVDGLHPVGPERRRYLYEHHGFVLGIPLVNCSADASPLVIWEGSHRIMSKMFLDRLGNLETEKWSQQDLTESYHGARREAFERCRRVAVHCAPGESYLVHRHALHGVAPWAPDAIAGDDGRMICYFRPELASRGKWLRAP